MKEKRVALIILGLALSSGVVALGTDEETASSEPSFKVLDVNQDGFISKSEALYSGMSDKKFAVWDHNGDDMLSEQEYDSGVKEAPVEE